MQRVILVVLDGWGLRNEKDGNSIKLAKTPNFDSLRNKYPFTKLKASGKSVGLPERILGGSEVGHLHLGAGRIVKQKLLEINEAIKKGEFFENKNLKKAFRQVKKNNSNLHLLGLLSDGGVHSHIKHLFALLKLCKREGLTKDQVKLQCFLDGRDTPPKSALKYLEKLEEVIEKLGIGEISTLSGRYYSMDRDKRWDRTKKAYQAIVNGIGRKVESPEQGIKIAYSKGESDEFIVPSVIKDNFEEIKQEDSVILFNFRADRARQLTRAFVDENFDKFKVKELSDLCFASMTQYSEKLDTEVIFPPKFVENTFGEIIARKGLKQLRIAESEKEAHVTYFFNGQREKVFENENRIIIPSPSVSTYDKKPEMSAPEITEKVLKEIEKKEYDFILINYANGDMVGHTGSLEAAIKGVEVVDECLGKVVRKGKENDYTIIVTADHGNCDKMVDEEGNPSTSHTFSKVPLILVDEKLKKKKLSKGGLYNVGPTILKLMEIQRPEELSKDLFEE